jgi:N-acetylglucosamine-6-phosphate deacetylase
MPFALTGARIFDGDEFRDGHAVVIDGARIARVVEEAEVNGAIETKNLGGGLLAPGFVDVQVNGGGGALLNDEATAETVRRIAHAHRKFGTTGLLPTVITDVADVRARAIAAVKEVMRDDPAVLGIHIEGPFIDVARKGAHEARFIREMTESDVREIAAIDCGAVMLTLAPNKVKPEFVRKLAEAGVLVSLGHSDASFAEAQAALAAGARAFTHLYNAMSPVTAREPGMVGAALDDSRSYIGIIADGHHVHDAALKIALAAKPRDRIMLVSDAMPPAAGGPHSFVLQGRTIRRHDGRLQLDNNTLAGSNLTMDEAVRYCVEKLGIALADALRMASLNPATFLRRGNDLGRIGPGYFANLVHLGDDLRVRQTWIEGK